MPKQDHLVCFLGGSLMLGATTTGAMVDHVSIPPRTGELTDQGERDWLTGVELINTCMATHDTQTYVLMTFVDPVLKMRSVVWRLRLYISVFQVTAWRIQWLLRIGILRARGMLICMSHRIHVDLPRILPA